MRHTPAWAHMSCLERENENLPTSPAYLKDCTFCNLCELAKTAVPILNVPTRPTLVVQPAETPKGPAPPSNLHHRPMKSSKMFWVVLLFTKPQSLFQPFDLLIMIQKMILIMQRISFKDLMTIMIAESNILSKL